MRGRCGFWSRVRNCRALVFAFLSEPAKTFQRVSLSSNVLHLLSSSLQGPCRPGVHFPVNNSKVQLLSPLRVRLGTLHVNTPLGDIFVMRVWEQTGTVSTLLTHVSPET